MSDPNLLDIECSYHNVGERYVLDKASYGLTYPAGLNSRVHVHNVSKEEGLRDREVQDVTDRCARKANGDKAARRDKNQKEENLSPPKRGLAVGSVGSRGEVKYDEHYAACGLHNDAEDGPHLVQNIGSA